MSVISMKNLLEAGVHFGHQTRRWDPKMAKYIFAERNGIYIIDLQKTVRKVEEAYSFLRDLVTAGGTIIFVGTKKQAQETVKSEAERCGMYYVNQRWLGGLLTNFVTIKKRIQRLNNLEKMEVDGSFENLSKKEIGMLRKERMKLDKYLSGIKDMKRVPNAMYVVDSKKELIAVREARKLGIPVIGIVDTNCDPDDVDYIIPGNDDAIRAVKLISMTMANAVLEGKQEAEFKLSKQAKEAEEGSAGEETAETDKAGEVVSDDTAAEAAEEPAAEEPAAEAAEEPAAEEPAAEAAEEPATEEPADGEESPDEKTIIATEPAVDQGISETPESEEVPTSEEENESEKEEE